MSDDRIVGPYEMGQQLIEALGLQAVKGILKLQISLEAGELPTLTIVRTITHQQAGCARALLVEWNCKLQPQGEPVEREVKPDGSVVEVDPPLFPNLPLRAG